MKDSVLNPSVVAVVPRVLKFLLCVNNNCKSSAWCHIGHIDISAIISQQFIHKVRVSFNSVTTIQMSQSQQLCSINTVHKSLPEEKWWLDGSRPTRPENQTHPTRSASHSTPSQSSSMPLEAGPLLMLFWSSSPLWKQHKPLLTLICQIILTKKFPEKGLLKC